MASRNRLQAAVGSQSTDSAILIAMHSVDSTAGLLHPVRPPEPESSSVLPGRSLSPAPQMTPSQVGAVQDLARTLPVEYNTTRQEAADAPRSSSESDATDVHLLSVDELVGRYRTSARRGLMADEAAARLVVQGPNTIKAAPINWVRRIAGYLFGGFCWLLWIAAVITFLSWQPLGQPPALANLALAIVLLIVIVLQAVFTAYQDWTSSRVMRSINTMLPRVATVLRSGHAIKVPIASLVTGDVVVLKYGTKVPADLRLIDVHGLRVDNSILTGESMPVHCTVGATNVSVNETRNIALMGTHITEGEAVGVVVATGDRTMMGKVANLAGRAKAKSTILQHEIQRFVYIIAALAISTGVLCMIVWAAWLRVDYPDYLNLSNMLSTVMGVIVAYVPEGLPIAVTLVLTIIARRMYKQKVLVKNLTTVETLGCVDVLCSDKTGTLTTNQMVVGSVAVAGRVRNVGIGRMVDDDARTAGFRQLVTVAHLCNGATFDTPADGTLPMNARRVTGDATDTAMLRFAGAYADVDAEKLQHRRVHHIPFNSTTKFMVTVVRTTASAAATAFGAAAAADTPILLMKGAPDVILAKCTEFVDDDVAGSVRPLGLDERNSILGLQEAWGSQGQRVLLVARRALRDGEFPEQGLADDSEIGAFLHDLCVIGIVGIVDPPRPETADVVRTIRGAGVRVFMVTGDFASTAAAIARQVGIFTHPTTHGLADVVSESKSNTTTTTTTSEPAAASVTPAGAAGTVTPDGSPAVPVATDRTTNTSQSGMAADRASLLLSGTDVAALTDADWHVIARQYDEIVFARTTPEQKYKIVKAFQARKSIVAVTGDGVNDAPALKNAEIGIAMGSGSDVAMEAASMVLLDSSFSSIVEALRQGRTVFDNLKKVCIYLLPAGSFAELMPVLVTIFLGVPAPLSSFLMICICVLTDMAPAMSLMYEKGESDLLTRKPRRPGQDSLVNAKLICHAYLFLGVIEAFCAHLMYFAYMQNEWGVAPSQLIFAFSNWGTDGYAGLSAADQVTANNGGQCVYFVTLVIMQFGNLLSTRTRRLSMFQQSPFKNKYLFLAMPCSILIAIILLYGPAIQNVFGTRPIPVQYWFYPIPLAMLIMILDELRKYCVRRYPVSLLARLAW